MDLLSEMPPWYLGVAILWSACQGYRGTQEHKLSNAGKKDDEGKLQKWQDRWIILYLHDFVFRSVCTMGGFIALFVAYRLMTNIDINELPAGGSLLLIFLFFVGVIGVGGQLHYIILFNKFPWQKP